MLDYLWSALQASRVVASLALPTYAWSLAPLNLASHVQPAQLASDKAVLTWSDTWTTLGPFRIGTREVIWGADPLELYGGFVNLSYQENATFPSSLTPNATVKWSKIVVEADYSTFNSATALFNLNYTGVDWEFMQSVYGWSALQYQGWIRGVVRNHSRGGRKALIYPVGIVEFYINDKHIFGGDFYGFNRTPILVDLEPGDNTVNVRLIRDVRANGGVLPATISASMQVELVENGVHLHVSHIVVPDIVNGRLITSYASIPVTNLYDTPIFIHDCALGRAANETPRLLLDRIRLVPGQTRPVAFTLLDIEHAINSSVLLCYVLETEGDQDPQRFSVPFTFRRRSMHEAQKITFLHPSQAVSYAILKPPRTNLTSADVRPLFVELHGAGVETDSPQVRQSLDGAPELQAFVLFPSGMSPWSGDDWHVWGHADVLAAIDAVDVWVNKMSWSGPLPETQKIFISGHSNGGQGTWFFCTHIPDRTLAAAPISGYSSIENYVPYSFWTESDPLKKSIVSMARSSFRHELLLANIAQIPIYQQHGSADDNVPPYHSRLLRSLLANYNGNSTYVELAGAGHYFDGVLTTQPIRRFYDWYLTGRSSVQQPVSEFSFVSLATSEMGSKYGLVIDQLSTPDRLGSLHVKVRQGNDRDRTWHVRTANVLRLRFDPSAIVAVPPDVLELDDQVPPIIVGDLRDGVSFLRSANGSWAMEQHKPTIFDRSGPQRGALDAIMRSQGAFRIVSGVDTMTLAVQVSRNMFQYFGADSEVMLDNSYEEASMAVGNVITICLGSNVPRPKLDTFPITFGADAIQLKSQTHRLHTVKYELGLGAVLLRPLSDGRLELLVWGSDHTGLRQAARLVPSLTGGGQPDFVILSSDSKWQGTNGALALGFFDYAWNISAGSYLP